MRRLIMLTAALAGAACTDPTPPTAPRAVPAMRPGAQVEGVTITLQGLPGLGENAYARAINELGQVVGIGAIPVPPPYPYLGGRAVLWPNPSTIVDLGSLVGGVYSNAAAINNTGQVVGFRDPGGAFRWTPGGGVVDLGPLGGAGSSGASGINDAGYVVGYSVGPDYVQHAVMWSPTNVVTELDVGGPGTEARDINNAGQVLLNRRDPSGSFYRAAVLMPNGALVDIGTLGGMSTDAWAINDAGQVVGSSYLGTADGASHAFLWTPGAGMKDLGTLGGRSSVASGLNEAGDVVGSSALPPPAEGGHAFVWSAATGMIDLGTLHGLNSQAQAINNRGQIAGYVGDFPMVKVPASAMLWTVTLPRPALTPGDLIAGLGAAVDRLVEQGVLTKGEAQGLRAKLAGAAGHVESQKNKTAANVLGAFINQVEAYVKAGKLTPAQGAQLTSAAESAREFLTT